MTPTIMHYDYYSLVVTPMLSQARESMVVFSIFYLSWKWIADIVNACLVETSKTEAEKKIKKEKMNEEYDVLLPHVTLQQMLGILPNAVALLTVALFVHNESRDAASMVSLWIASIGGVSLVLQLTWYSTLLIGFREELQKQLDWMSAVQPQPTVLPC